jgi:DNA-directed RNA polymerase specialized sigma24 family protein
MIWVEVDEVRGGRIVGHKTAILGRAMRLVTVAAKDTDRELLARYTGGDEAAFASLVSRHTAMVLGVCRRGLPTLQDAEDACQATFLVLARKAGSGRWQSSIANWLYTTARKIAHNSRVSADRRVRKEKAAALEDAMHTRRDFLKSSTLLALTPTVPVFLAQTARAIAPARDARILVVIQLSGGNDGINTVVPFKDEGYAKHRKILRLPVDQLHKITTDVGLHPEMGKAAKLLEAGRLAIVQGVGYPNPNRSHFKSMAIWQTANVKLPREDVLDTQTNASLGWIGRALDVGASPGRFACSTIHRQRVHAHSPAKQTFGCIGRQPARGF